jgi:hypothetical protein
MNVLILYTTRKIKGVAHSHQIFNMCKNLHFINKNNFTIKSSAAQVQDQQRAYERFTDE